MALIGLISDVHASPEPVAEALAIFAREGVEQVLCAGDIAGYMDDLEQTITLLRDSECQCILGNHDLSYLEQRANEKRVHEQPKHEQHEEDADDFSSNFLKQLPLTYTGEYAGKRLYMVHAQPPDECHGGIKLLDKNGEVHIASITQWAETLQGFNHDILVVGHTHQVFVEQIAGTLVINPGSSVFNHCCAILQVPEMIVELFALSGKKIVKTWNWGQYVI